MLTNQIPQQQWLTSISISMTPKSKIMKSFYARSPFNCPHTQLSLSIFSPLFPRTTMMEKKQPTVDSLMATFQHMLQCFKHIFILLDALDECKEREDLLELLEIISSWHVEELHILATSRKGKEDIEESLESLITFQVGVDGDLVDADIHTYICERLRNNAQLRKWPERLRMEIEAALVEGAHGMWVVYAASFASFNRLFLTVLQGSDG